MKDDKIVLLLSPAFSLTALDTSFIVNADTF